jgi:hypothetical protein
MNGEHEMNFCCDFEKCNTVTLAGILVDKLVGSPQYNIKDIIRVVDCHLIDKGDPNKITELCWDIWSEYGPMNCLFYIDGSNRAMVDALKIRWDESLNWEQVTFPLS